MFLDFLEAADGAALCKTHTADNHGNITTTPYPLTKFFNSHRVTINDLGDLFHELQNHARQGHCAIKGKLNKSLSNEERKGATSPTEATQWLCLDLDFESGFSSVDDFVNQLGPEFADTSYIFQHSNSAGIKSAPGLRGHIYFILDTPVSPRLIKEWLKEKNLTIPALSAQLSLAKNGHSLIWPLDISTCQNDKLIFIAPPVLVNCTASVTKWFTLHQKTRGTLSFTPTPNPSANKSNADKHIQQLRKAAGLPTVKAKYKQWGSETVLTNPDPMVITETRVQGDYVRVNLVGDNPSWGYYYHASNPEILYNFKGAPLVKLRDVDPTYYATLHATAKAAQQNIPVIFRDPRADAYYNGLYDTANDTLELHMTSNVQKIDHFLQNHNIDMVDFIPDWTYEFDPTTNKVIDFNAKWANKFSPTPYLRESKKLNGATVPPTIERIIRSITTDQPTYEHFINWLAFVYQTRQKTGTAWLFSGIEGTGKGLLASQVLQPIFGERYVTRITSENLDDLFNSNFEEAIFVFVDEFNLENMHNVEKVHNKIKNLITENRITIRRMRTNPYEAPSFLNLIMATNAHAALPLSDNDRRFNIAPPQERKLVISSAEVLGIRAELPAFSVFLNSLQIDEQAAKTVIINQARADLIDRAHTSTDLFFKACREGDIEYFLDYLPYSDQTVFDVQANAYQQIIKSWVQNHATFIPADELREAFNFLQNTRTSSSKFGRACAHHQLKQSRQRIDNRNVRGYHIPFPKIDSEKLFVDRPSDNVVRLQ